jgi:L-fuculose-phosphate aldolase
MEFERGRRQVVEYGLKLAGSTLASGTSGNISVRDPDSGLVAISPSSMDYGAIQSEDVVVLDPTGRVVDGERRPSSECGMHLAAYQAREDAGAVVHTHSPAATTLAVLGRELPAVHYMIALAGSATVPLVPYHLYGTEALAGAAGKGLANSRGCLLQNHGVLATGPDIHQAWALAEQLEFCADIYLRATAVGEPGILTQAQIAEVIGQLHGYQRQD